MPTRALWGINFVKSSYEDCLLEIQKRLTEGQKTLIVTPNPEMLYAASQDKKLQEILKSAQLALPDGVGIFVGYQIVASRLPKWMKYIMLPYWCLRAILQTEEFKACYGERITGSRLTPDILALAAKNGIGVTIIDPVVTGNSPSDILKRASQEKMQSIIETKYPGIQCTVLVTDGDEYFMGRASLGNQQNEGNLLNKLNPVIIATHGNGTQEKIVMHILSENPSVLLGIGIGSSIDLLTGFRTPAPILFRRFGGEWLYRLYKNPRKHIKRMGNVWQFLKRCCREI